MFVILLPIDKSYKDDRCISGLFSVCVCVCLNMTTVYITFYNNNGWDGSKLMVMTLKNSCINISVFLLDILLLGFHFEHTKDK